MSEHPSRSAREGGRRPPPAVIFQYVSIAFIVVSSVAWTVETISYIRRAPESAKRVCAGKNIWTGAEDAYYWCLQRVQAGGKP